MLNRRVMYQLLAIVIFALVYVVGKEYLIAYDFTGIPSFFYPYFNVGIMMLLAACGFSFIAFTVIEKESNRGTIPIILFALLQMISFVIVIEFYTIQVFHVPVIVQVIGILFVILLVMMSAKNSRIGSSS
jgi:drug/metabolite transporter (DMT)-like permease